jgi:hypothetical protein
VFDTWQLDTDSASMPEEAFALEMQMHNLVGFYYRLARTLVWEEPIKKLENTKCVNPLVIYVTTN